MIVFRVDANTQNGTGHIMRCLAIAKELVAWGEKVVFITADEYPTVLIKQEGFCHVVLKTDWMRMEEEIAELLLVLDMSQADLMIVDSYYVTPDYFKQIRKSVAVAYFDDFAREAFDVDVIINYNIFSDMLTYGRLYRGYATELLIGTQYVPLRDEFCFIKPPPIREQIANILITTGGTDPLKISQMLAERILQDAHFDRVRIHVAVGRYYCNTLELGELSRRYPQFIIHENVRHMSELMLRCDIAVSASGTTLYELCACGIPSVIFSFVDNQTQIRECFGKSGAMIDCGDFRNWEKKCLKNIIQALKTLECPQKRTELRTKAMSITDGQGALRLTAHLAGFARQKRLCIDKD